MTFTAYPTERKKRIQRTSWKAPEHAKSSLGMRRDRWGNLIVDPRPSIMVPERPKIHLGLFNP